MRTIVLGMLLAAAVDAASGQQVDFGSQVLPVFQENCGCHGGQNDLFLDSYANVMAGTSTHGPVIIPGNGSGSVLIQKLKGTTFGARMPAGGPYLDAATIDVIKRWIDQGAKATITSVEISAGVLPNRIALAQNYPNPFNPGTVISFQLKDVSVVSLKVFDVLGNEVAVLVNGQKPAGTYRVTFDASRLPSGIYFCSLAAGGAVVTKKMILTK